MEGECIMRPASFGIVFAMLFLCFATISDHGTAALQEISFLRINYNNCLDSAIEDAMTESVEIDNGRQVRLNKEEVVDSFFTAMAVNFDAMENSGRRELLKACVPVIAFVERSKVTFFYDFLNEGNTREVWFEKKWKDFRIYFTLTDYIRVENMETGDALEGDFHDIGKVYDIPFFQEESWFYEEQKRLTREVLLENLEEIVKEHNVAVKRLGIQYRFFLPVIKDEEWYREIDQISMLVLFQGYPYGSHTIGYYNRMAIGGAEIKKKGYEYR